MKPPLSALLPLAASIVVAMPGALTAAESLPSKPAQAPAAQVLFTDTLTGGKAAAKNGITWDLVNANRGSVTQTPDGLRFRFDAGVINSFAEQRLRFPKTFDFTIAYDLTLPANYEHRKNPNDKPGCTGDCASNNKGFLNIWGGDYNRPATLGIGINLWPNADGTSGGTVYYFRGDQAAHDWNAMPKAIEREDIGKKMSYVIHAYAPTATAVGGLEMWKKRPGGSWIKISSSKAPDWGYQSGQAGFDQAYILGWANSGFAQQTDFVLSNVRVAYDRALIPTP